MKKRYGCNIVKIVRPTKVTFSNRIMGLFWIRSKEMILITHKQSSGK
jgi:hypothetical protein